MALFGNKTKKEVAPKVEKTSEPVSVVSNPIKSVLLRPRVTEKASYVAEKQNAYVFDIPFTATKGAVRNAFVATYKIHPIRVSIVRTPGKSVFSRGKAGMTNQSKKAYVYLKTGDKIEIA